MGLVEVWDNDAASYCIVVVEDTDRVVVADTVVEVVVDDTVVEVVVDDTGVNSNCSKVVETS